MFISNLKKSTIVRDVKTSQGPQKHLRPQRVNVQSESGIFKLTLLQEENQKQICIVHILY